jgi:uncharacterized phiE125 gp8 family phage protein
MQRLAIPDGSVSALVTAPAAPLLTTADAKAHLRVDHSGEDDLIAAYVTAANDMLDAQFGELGRALVTQTWKLVMPSLTGTYFDLPVPPVQSITSITYYDADNAEQTLSTGVYRLTAQNDSARVDLVDGQSWPVTYSRTDAVTVTYVTGYGNAGTDAPEGIRMAARLLVSHWYDNRSAVTERGAVEVPMAVKFLLAKYRVARGFI